MLGLGSFLIWAGAREPISITSVSPTHGTSAGGTVLTIHGHGFSTATHVQFVLDGAHVTLSFVIISDTEIHATTVAEPAGREYDLKVANPISSDTLASAYTYDSGSEWLPSSLGVTVRLDLDARHVTLDADPTKVAVMLDQSGNGYHASLGGVGSLPTYSASESSYNGLPAVVGGNDALLITPAGSADTGSNPITIILVGHVTAPTGATYSVSRSTQLAFGAADEQWREVVAGAAYASTFPEATPSIVIATYEADPRVYANSTTAQVLTGAPAPGVSAGFGYGVLNYSDSPAAGFAHAGPITRVIVFDGSLTQPQAEAALAGLSALYGVEIDGFAPQMRTDNISWYDGRSTASASALVSEWPDQGVNGGHHLVQATDANKPTLVGADTVYGGENTLSFDGVASYMLSAVGVLRGQPMRVYYVGEQAGVTGYFFDESPAATERLAILYAAGIDVVAPSELNTNPIVPPTNTPYVFCVVLNGASTSIYIDNPVTPVLVGDAGPNGFDSLTVGSRVSLENFFEGKFAALGFFDGAGDVTERTAMFTGLRARFGFAAWSPLDDVGTLSLLLMPGDYVAGTGVWADSSGHGRDAAASVISAASPTDDGSGNPVFDGASTALGVGYSAADNVSFPGATLSNLDNGTIIVIGKVASLAVDDPSVPYSNGAFVNGSLASPQLTITDAGAVADGYSAGPQYDVAYQGTPAAGVFHLVAGAWDSTGICAAVDSDAFSAATAWSGVSHLNSGNIGSTTYIGRSFGAYLNCTMKLVAFYPTKVSDAKLAQWHAWAVAQGLV